MAFTAHLFVPDGEVAEPGVAAVLEAVLEGVDLGLVEELGAALAGLVVPDDRLLADVERAQAVRALEVVRHGHLRVEYC